MGVVPPLTVKVVPDLSDFKMVPVQELVRLDVKPGELLAVVLPEGAAPHDLGMAWEILAETLQCANLDWPFIVVRHGTRFEALQAPNAAPCWAGGECRDPQTHPHFPS